MHAERCRCSQGVIFLLCKERLRRKHHFRLVTCCGLIRKKLILKAEWYCRYIQFVSFMSSLVKTGQLVETMNSGDGMSPKPIFFLEMEGWKDRRKAK